MGRIVAIGGGKLEKLNKNAGTWDIDLEILKMTEKSRPKLLFIPTASNDSKIYFETIQNHFGKDLGCEIFSLELHNRLYSYKELESIIFSSDIVYVGGGNTRMMLEKWTATGLDHILIEAYHKTDIVLSGLSAGAICWFKYGSSDSDKFDNPEAKLINLPGLDLLDLTVCPHFDVEFDRAPHFKALLQRIENTGIGLDDCCALKIEDDKYQIISSKESANAWILKWETGNYHEVKLKHGSVGNLDQLFATPGHEQ